jgi:uncharacterized membrane protein
MARSLLALLSLYGFRLSFRSTRTIVRLAHEAAEGDVDATGHFTQTPYAHALGPRNSDLGMLFYGSLALAAATDSLRGRTVSTGFYYGSAFSVGLSVYLLWALVFRLRVLCPICLRGHATNLATFALLARLRSQEPSR